MRLIRGELCENICLLQKNGKEDSDVALVRARSVNEAVRILGKYYNNIDKNKDIRELDLEEMKDIIIISDY